MNKRLILCVLLVAALFLALRLPGLGLPYHQDEWKNVESSATVEAAGQFFAHPPVFQMLFVASYKLFGVDDMRLLPLIFSIVSAVLLYAVVKRRADKETAVWSVIIYSLCFYGIFGSLQMDVDGAILPALFLLAVYAYDRLSADRLSAGERSNKKWLVLLAAALLVGTLVKLNFVLIIGAITLDYLWENRRNQIYKKVGIAAGSLIAFGVVYIALLYFIQAIYPAFSISFMIGHANQFSDAGGRNWTQIVVQGVKAIYYLSPLLLLPLFWINKETIKKTRVFGLYLVLGLIFYFGLFDFSRGALDKYLMFAIVPLAVIVGVILSKIFADVLRRRDVPSGHNDGVTTNIVNNDYERSHSTKVGEEMSSWSRLWWPIIIGLALSILLVVLNFLPQAVVALYPKTEWFGRVLHGQWNVLTPLNGGSGPLGFYVSFLFIAGSYIVSLIVAVVAMIKKQWRSGAAVILVMIGLTYNLVFTQELFFGGINGSAPKALDEAIGFISKSAAVKKVMTFNDSGAGPLSLMGKYGGRIYATPESEEGYRKKFSGFDGDYLVVDIPRFSPSSLYYRFFAKCDILFESGSKSITGKVYDCSRAKEALKTL